jgi:hypothetical protein
VLAAIDLDTDRGNSRRVIQIKQAVLGACRVRYLRCPVDNLPSIAELQLLVPTAGATRGPQPAPVRNVHNMRDAMAAPAANRRRERATLWQDSTFFQDSFFAPDSRVDAVSGASADVAAPATASSALPGAERDEDNGGGVGDPPRYGSTTRH